jgi:hypothetical protein
MIKESKELYDFSKSEEEVFSIHLENQDSSQKKYASESIESIEAVELKTNKEVKY